MPVTDCRFCTTDQSAYGICAVCRPVYDQAVEAMKKAHPGARVEVEFKVRCPALCWNNLSCELELNHKHAKHVLISKGWIEFDDCREQDEGPAGA